MKFFEDNKDFFKKYCLIVLILNVSVLGLTLILYPLLFVGIIVPVLGNILGIMFLCNIFSNLLFVHLNSKFLIKTHDKGKVINRVTYCYLFLLVFAVFGFFAFPGQPIGVGYFTTSLIIYAFPIILSYYELTVIDDREGIFKW